MNRREELATRFGKITKMTFNKEKQYNISDRFWESFMESEKKKALRTLLGEVGAVKEF